GPLPEGDRGDDLLAYLAPWPQEQHAVFLKDRAECTFAEAGKMEGVSETTMRNRYKAGIQRLRALLARDGVRGAAVLPLLAIRELAELLRAPPPEPPPEAIERLLARAAAELGLDPPPPRGAPRVPRAHAPWGPAPLAGAIGGLVTGGLLLAVAA